MAEKDRLTYDQLKKDTELFNRYYDRANAELATGGYKITSTVDQSIYEAMQESTAINGSKIGPTYQTPYIDQNTGEAKRQTDMAQNGAVLIENNTGRILGFVAGRDFQVNQVDHAFSTHRSPGSTIKPLLVYAPAMETILFIQRALFQIQKLVFYNKTELIGNRPIMGIEFPIIS